MLYYLDTNIVIYAVAGQPPLRQGARNHIAALENAGHTFVISELTWTECPVWPFRAGDGPVLLESFRPSALLKDSRAPSAFRPFFAK